MNTINGRTPEEIRKGLEFSEYLDEALPKVTFAPPEDGEQERIYTPEEIKRKLGCLMIQASGACEDNYTCHSCNYRNEVYMEDCDCFEAALALIQQLERERDALLKDFKNYQNRQFDAHKGPYACDLCKWGDFYGFGGNCKCPDSATCIRMEKWEWRGVQEVE